MRRRWLACLLVLAACGADPVEPVAAPTACADLTVIGARGSGQAVDSAEPSGFGREAGALALEVGAAAVPLGWETAYVGVDYPAVDVPTARARPDAFLDSVRAGALDALASARDAVDACPSTQLVVIGSSQGAAVAHGVAALLSTDASLSAVRDRVLGVVLLGDPTRRRTDGEVEHVDPGGVAASDGFLATDRLDVGPGLAGRVLSVCAVGDTVCASPAGATWTDLEISLVHNTAYTLERVGPIVLGWLSQRTDRVDRDVACRASYCGLFFAFQSDQPTCGRCGGTPQRRRYAAEISHFGTGELKNCGTGLDGVVRNALGPRNQARRKWGH